MKPPAIMYKHEVDSYVDGLTYVDGYLYQYEWDWDSHRYLLVRVNWLEARYLLLKDWFLRQVRRG